MTSQVNAEKLFFVVKFKKVFLLQSLMLSYNIFNIPIVSLSEQYRGRYTYVTT